MEGDRECVRCEAQCANLEFLGCSLVGGLEVA